MTSPVTGFFWSYTHLDNEYDHGRIRHLAELIKREYSMQTQCKLDVFMDVTHLRWGREWQSDIDQGVKSARFLIPIITPGYLLSNACRSELLGFAAHMKSVGIERLILPILYLDTPALGDDASSDEAVLLIKRMQYEDWRQLRFEAEDSPSHRSGVSRIVNRLRELAATADSQRRAVSGGQPESPASAPPTDVDILAELEQAIPRWGASFKAVYDLMGEIADGAVTMADELQPERLDLRAGVATARVAALQRYADTIMPKTLEILELASQFSAEAIELDPHLLIFIRAVEAGGPIGDLVDFACDLILLIAPRLRQNITVITSQVEAMSSAYSRASRVLRPSVTAVETAMRRVADGFGRVEEWEQRLLAAGREKPDIPGLGASA
jgi:TIR domain